MAIYSAQQISTKRHLLEFSTVTHVVKNQINILNERPRDISLVPSDVTRAVFTRA